MNKIFLTLIFVASLNAELVNGVALIVKGAPITLYDIKDEMRTSNVDVKSATDTLIRKKLETIELQERKISVSSTDVYDNIKKTASANGMSVNDFYDAVRSSRGLSSTEFKEKTKERILSQKLYHSISYRAVVEPSDDEAKEYFELHKKEFTHPISFDVIVYSSKNKKILKKKTGNPMFFSSEIIKEETTLIYENISPELANFLENSKVKNFTQIIPNGKGAYVSFYIKKIEHAQKSSFKDFKNRVVNMIMSDKREQVLSDYFARLRNNAEIEIIREVKIDAQ